MKLVVAGTMVEVVGTVRFCLFLIVYANFCFGTPILFMRRRACVVLSGWRVKNVALWKIGANGTVWEFHGFSNGAVYGI